MNKKEDLGALIGIGIIIIVSVIFMWWQDGELSEQRTEICKAYVPDSYFQHSLKEIEPGYIQCCWKSYTNHVAGTSCEIVKEVKKKCMCNYTHTINGVSQEETQEVTILDQIDIQNDEEFNLSGWSSHESISCGGNEHYDNNSERYFDALINIIRFACNKKEEVIMNCAWVS